MIYLYPYRQGSKSVKALSEAAGLRRIKRNNSKFKGGPRKVVINWGATALSEEVKRCRVLNPPHRINKASNKLTFFNAAKDRVRTVPWTVDQFQALDWLAKDGLVIARTQLRGHSGEGIVVVRDNQDMVDAPLYTRYIKKTSEWRVHIFNEQVIDIQRKVRDNDVPDDEVNWQIRNHRNGFFYQRNNLAPPECVFQESMKAIRCINLDFGAVDVIYNQHYDQAYVLEINCAPGLVGSTVYSYAQAVQEVK